MALLSPATSVANQIRNRTLGVNQGGTSGRMTQLHMGTTGSRRGGANTRGSGRAVGIVPAGTPAPVGPRPTNTRPAMTFRDSAGNIRRTRANPLFGTSVRRPTTGRPTTGQAGATPVTPDPQPAAPTNPLDYRSQSDYIRNMAMLNDELARDRRGLAKAAGENQRAYDKEIAQAKEGFEDSVTGDHAQLAARGLSSSGTREDVDADRFKEFNRYMADIEQNLGTGATARLQEALGEIERREALEREAIEAQAREQWSQMYPAAPIAEPVAPTTPAPAQPSAPRMTMQQAVAQFKGARTFRAGDGSTRRTAAWTNFLRSNGLL